jgi:hypothetical protein
MLNPWTPSATMTTAAKNDTSGPNDRHTRSAIVATPSMMKGQHVSMKRRNWPASNSR